MALSVFRYKTICNEHAVLAYEAKPFCAEYAKRLFDNFTPKYALSEQKFSHLVLRYAKNPSTMLA